MKLNEAVRMLSEGILGCRLIKYPTATGEIHELHNESPIRHLSYIEEAFDNEKWEAEIYCITCGGNGYIGERTLDEISEEDHCPICNATGKIWVTEIPVQTRFLK